MANKNRMEIELVVNDLMNKKLKSILKKGETTANQSAKTITQQFKTLQMQIIAAYSAWVVAIRPAIDLTKKAISLATEQELVIKRLSIATENAGYVWSEVSKKVLDFANSMQRVTAYGDNVIEQLIQELLPYTDDLDKAMRGAKIAMDMASAGLFDIGTSAKYVGMAMQGNVEMLGRYIGELRSNANAELKSMTAAEKTAYALDLLQKKYGGMAEGEIKSFHGATAQLNNVWGDFLEELGFFITKSETVNESIQKTTNLLYGLTDALEGMREGDRSWQNLALGLGISMASRDIANRDDKNLFGAEEAGRAAMGLPEMPEDTEIKSFLETEEKKREAIKLTADFNKKLDKEISDFARKAADEQKKLLQDQMKYTLEASASMAGSIATILEVAQGESKKYGAAIKALRIGETVINTASAIMRVWAEVPYPANFAQAIAVAAAGAAQIATISAQPMAEGGQGVVTKPTLFLAGEAGAEAFSFSPLSKGGGTGGNVYVEINNPSIRSDDDIDSLVEAVSRQLAYETDRIR